MKQRRLGLRATALVILLVAALGVGGGFAIHVLGSGGGSSSPSNPAGLHGQATWETS